MTSGVNNVGSVNTDEMYTESFDLIFELLSLGKCEAERPFPYETISFPNPKTDEFDIFHLNLKRYRR